MFTGDVMLARSIGARIERRGPEVVFRAVSDALRPADLVVVNLECAISDGGTREEKVFTFRAPPAAADALASAGVDVASLANNHALDYGLPALRDTRRLLDERGIVTVGAGENEAEAHAPVIVERNGLRLAFLAYARRFHEIASGWSTDGWAARGDRPGLAIGSPEVVARDVRQARERADVVIVMFHAGIERAPAPDALQRALARAAIRNGAALVVGHHPHRLQGVEEHPNALVAYSLGDFVFDLSSGIYTDSAILDVTLAPTGVADYGWIPVRIENGLPRLATPAEAARILRLVAPLDGR